MLSLVGITMASHPLVQIPGLGSVKGTYMLGGNASSLPTNTSGFLGIPFAMPPVGDLRWREPRDHGPWMSDLLNATQFGDCCMQNWLDWDPGRKVSIGQSEDCLYLNVYSPTEALNGKQKLPVMFWIHGGAYTTGCSNLYSGAGLIHNSDLKVVVVTTNYRLNVFGFMGTTDLKSRTNDGSFGNYGIQDQRLAMEWVNKHIKAFGGDPSRVTIFGESAGGSSVINHLAQKSSYPFYGKAIIESGTYQGASSLAHVEARYESVKQLTKCKDLECLLKLPANALSDAVNETSKTATWSWGPAIDGVSLTDTPWNLVHNSKYNNEVPIMIGSNRDEYALFAFLSQGASILPATMTELQLALLLAGKFKFNPEELWKVKEIYNPSKYPYPRDLGNFSSWWWAGMRIFTDQVPGLGPCGARNFAQSLHEGRSPAVFSYLFAHPPQRGSLPGAGPGNVVAAHAFEIQYVFGSQLAEGEETDLSANMSRYWTNFAITGNPNGADLPRWAKYDGQSNSTQILQCRSEGGIISQRGLQRHDACDFWDSHPEPTSPELVDLTSSIYV